MVTMETMTVRKISTSVLASISKFYNCTKFHFHQVAGEKVVNNKNFQLFASDHLKVSEKRFAFFEILVKLRHYLYKSFI